MPLPPVARHARDRLYKLQCHGKKGFPTTDAAEAEIRRAWAHDGTIGTYLCPWCRLFHIGHSPKRQSNRKPKPKV